MYLGVARYTLYILEYGKIYAVYLEIRHDEYGKIYAVYLRIWKIYAIYLGIWQDIRCLSCVYWEIYSEIRCCMRDLLERDLLLHENICCLLSDVQKLNFQLFVICARSHTLS